MPIASVTVHIRKRDVIVLLSLTDVTDIDEARKLTVAHITDNGIDGDHGGVLKLVDIDQNGHIVVETDRFGFGISPIDIVTAIKANGREVSC